MHITEEMLVIWAICLVLLEAVLGNGYKLQVSEMPEDLSSELAFLAVCGLEQVT